MNCNSAERFLFGLKSIIFRYLNLRINKINIELLRKQLCLWLKHVRRSNNDCPFFSVFIIFPNPLYL